MELKANNLKIECFTSGLDAEQITLMNEDTRETVDEDEVSVILQQLAPCLSTSSNTLGKLLEERKKQVAKLEIVISELDRVFKEANIIDPNLIITFEID